MSRVSVPLRRACKLINHGPTTMVSSSSGGRQNVMTAAWVMPLDLDPPKIAAVIAADSYTRTLIEASGELVVNVPPVAMKDEAFARPGSPPARTRTRSRSLASRPHPRRSSRRR